MRKLTFLMLFVLMIYNVNAISPDPLTLSNWESGSTTNPTYSWTNTKSVIVDPLNGSNHILQLDRDPTGATYLGAQWTNTVEPFKTNGVALGNTSASQYKYIVVKAKKSTSYDMKIKLELPQSGTNIVTLTSLVASQQGQWTYYIFDAGLVNVTHKQFSIFPEFGGNTGAATTYFDEIYFTNTLPTIDFSTYKFPLTYSTGASSATVTKTYDIARSGTNIDITLLNSQLIPGATSYNVYDGATKLTSTYDAAKYVIKITGLTRSTNYNLQITAVNASNVESSKSEIIQFSTRSNTGSGYELSDDFEGSNLGWTTYGSPTINATATNTLTTGINASAKCLSVAVSTSSNYYAMAILPYEKILAGATYANYQYLHVKMRRPAAAAATSANVVLKLEKGGGQASSVSQEIPTISTVYNDDVWHDYVFDLKAAGVTNEPYYRQFDLMPNKLASGNQTASFTMYIDDIYLCNDATLSTANLSTVNIPVTISTSGSIATTTGARGYLSGDLAVVTATPNTNYRFTNWTLGSAGGAVQSTSSTYSFTVSGSTSLYANSIQTWTYTATSSDVTKGTVSGTGVYDNGSSVLLTATPNTGYSFVDWRDGSASGSLASSNATFQFTSGTAHKSYFANFIINTYTISVTANDANMGSVTGANTYNHGTSVSLTATPSSGYHFVNWTESSSQVSPDATYTFTASTNRTLVANFEPNTVPVSSGTINASAITCTTCDVTVASGAELTVGATKDLKSVTVAAGGKLTITAGNLNVTNGITLESTADATATLVDAYETPTVNATVKQYVTAGRNWYMSAPLNNTANVSDLNKGASVQYYNESTGLWGIASGTLTRGIGYIQVANSTQGTTGTVQFAGIVNSGDVSVSLTNNTAGRGFNLVGNPYPSYLNWSLVATDLVNTHPTTGAKMPNGTAWYRTIDYNGKSAWATGVVYAANSVVYNGTSFYKTLTGGTSGATAPTGTGTNISDGNVIWQNEGSVYIFATVSSNGTPSHASVSNLIPPMQAFWVKTNTGGGTLTFKNSMRAHESVSNKLKAPKSQLSTMPFVRLSVSNGASADQVAIYASENASNAFDSADAPKFFNISGSYQSEIYTLAGNEKLAINALNSIEEGTTLALGFVTEKENRFSLKVTEIANLPTNLQLILRDKQTNTEFNLSEGEAYQFGSSATNNAERFSLIFRAKGTNTGFDNKNQSKAIVYANAAGQIVIEAPAKINYAIYNAVGQLIENGVLNTERETRNTKHLAAGVYVVKVNNQSTRVIVK